MNARRQVLLLGLLAFSAALLTLPSVGTTDDDAYYQPAGHSYVRWVKSLVSEPAHALSRTQIDAHFHHNKEHPPFAKWLIGGGRWLGHEVLGVMSASEASRLGICAMLALAAMVAFAFTLSRVGALPAWFAALSLLLYPRFAFHGRVPTLDMTVAATTSAFLLCFWHLHRKPGFKPLALMGVIFGFALASKLNAPFALIGCGLYWMVEQLPKTRKDGRGFTLPPIPLWMLAVPAVGFALHLALWPHMWIDTFARYGSYVSFHTKHYPIYLFFEGQIWERPFAPWYAPFAYTWATLPTLTLFAGMIGLGGLLSRFGTQNEDGRFARFLLIHLFVSIGVVAFSPVPKYGGVKLFLPFFPLFAVAVGLGFARLLEALRAVGGQQLQKVWVGPFFALLMLSSGALDTGRFYGHELSSFGQHVGGLPGAVQRGFERQYYDVFDTSLAAWISEHTAAKASIHFEPNHKEYLRSAPFMIRRGLLREDVKLSASKRADIVILTHERRWRSFSDLAVELAKRPLLHEHRVDGVVLWSAYGRKVP
jgi:4-amino-4-deoxy-L-arabinose transferase-like glycosyltransferase